MPSMTEFRAAVTIEQQAVRLVPKCAEMYWSMTSKMRRKQSNVILQGRGKYVYCSNTQQTGVVNA